MTVLALREWCLQCGWIAALWVMFFSTIFSVLWSKTFLSNQTLSFSGLNLTHISLGRWNNASTFGFRWKMYALMVWTGYLLETGLENIFPSAWSPLPPRPPERFLLESTAPGSSKFFFKAQSILPLGLEAWISSLNFDSLCLFYRNREKRKTTLFAAKPEDFSFLYSPIPRPQTIFGIFQRSRVFLWIVPVI